MGRSDKCTVIRRVDDVLRLLLAGAEFSEIRQFASASGWDVTDRQIRRYTEAAYRRVAKIARRDRVQLLGRHLMQRRALYARAIKNQDLRTALMILRDEAALQWLYPRVNEDRSQQEALSQRALPGPQLTRRQRTIRRLQAEAKHDDVELRLVRETARRRCYQFDETEFPYQMLQTMALIYVAEQLERAGMFFQSVWRMKVEGDKDGMWDLIAATNAYMFRIGREGWTQFVHTLGIDGDQLIRGNHQGALLELCGDNICGLPITPEQLQTAFNARGFESKDFTTAEDQCRSWKRLFAQVCDDWYP